MFLGGLAYALLRNRCQPSMIWSEGAGILMTTHYEPLIKTDLR